MDLIRWFWMQLLCIFEAFKKKPQDTTTKTEMDPLRWIQPKHKWAWQDRSSEIQAYDERISKMKPNGTIRTMATFDHEVQCLHIWVGNTYIGSVGTNFDERTDFHHSIIDDAVRVYLEFLNSLEKIRAKHNTVPCRMADAFRKKLARKIIIWQVA